MTREYPEGALERVQSIETEMLSWVDAICRKHGLTYWIDGGTCLGAVRHQGFIPWDDDIDVGMPIDDFYRFRELSKDELPHGISLHQMESDPTQYVLWGKLYKEDTVFIEHDANEAGCAECVFIDVFPYIRLDERCGDRGVGHLRRTQFWTKLIYIYRIEDPTVLEALSWKAIAKVGWKAIHHCLRLVTTQERLRKRFAKACRARHPGEWWGNPSAAHPYPFHRTTLFEPVDLTFEGLVVRAPHDWDRFLRDLYKDYMELPPVEQRKTHLPLMLDLGDGMRFGLRDEEGSV